MRKLLASLVMLPLSALACERGFAPRLNELPLRGQGEAYYLGLFHLYDAALYQSDRGSPLAGDKPRCLEICYRREFTAAQLTEAAETLLARQGATRSTTVEQGVQAIHEAYLGVDEGDRYRLCYSPDSGTELALNERPLVNVPGSEFAAAYFGIWLGDAPISDDLRQQLLNTNAVEGQPLR